MHKTRKSRSVQEVIDSAGGIRPLARLLGISAPSVWEWRLRDQIPAARVLELERLTGVSRHVQRPDLYPVERSRTPKTRKAA
jgi:DNA-binding transcriptional regulator YdaS (Cro superfamily)